MAWYTYQDPASAARARTRDAVEPPRLSRRTPTTEDIESFRALGLEICIDTEQHGEIWIVPAYTDQPRAEITPEHLATIDGILDTFPGSRVVAFHSKIDMRSEQHTGPARAQKGEQNEDSDR